MTSKKITLDVWKNNSEFLTVKQGEINSRFLEITLKDPNGPLDLSNKTVKFQAKKIDGNVIYNNATIIDVNSGTIRVGLTSQMSAVSGLLNNCEIVITDVSGGSLIVGGINILVMPSLGEAIEESISELTAFQEIMESISNLKQHLPDKNNPHNVTAEQIGALSNTTKYGSSLEVDGNKLKLKDQDGNILNTITTNGTTLSTYSIASPDADGLMSSKDKAKLDTIEEYAQANIQSDWNSSDISSPDYIKNKPSFPSTITDLTGTLPLSNGGTGATDSYTAQDNLGLMKRYTDFSHLTLSTGYSLKDVFMAMTDNTYIECFISSNQNMSIVPTIAGLLKICRINQEFGYAEFYGANTAENAKWIGSLHYERSFNWNKVYTSNQTVQLKNGGTGTTSANSALSKLGAAKASDIGTVSNLNTTSKTIVGAINELYNLINS